MRTSSTIASGFSLPMVEATLNTLSLLVTKNPFALRYTAVRSMTLWSSSMSRIRGLVVGLRLAALAGSKLGDVVGLRLEALAGSRLGDVVGLRLEALAGTKLGGFVGCNVGGFVGCNVGGFVGFKLGGIPLVLRVESKRASDGSITFAMPCVSCGPTGTARAAPAAPAAPVASVAPVHGTDGLRRALGTHPRTVSFISPARRVGGCRAASATAGRCIRSRPTALPAAFHG
jgi:hypothetical protein